jgi:hypothetical protein
MPRVTLLEKVYGTYSAENFESVFSSLCKGLRVRLKVVGKTDRGWIQAEVSGEDETVALNYLDQEVGLALASTEELKKFSTVRGRVISSEESENQLRVDIGIFSPQICDAVIPLKSLQAQLADGKELSLQQISGLFCLYDNLPLKVKAVGGVEAGKKSVEAELSEAQLSQVKRWIRSNLDRLLVLGAPFSDVERAVYASKHVRDIVEVESLGLLEHVVVCKLGTYAVGLTPRLGRFLPRAVLAPFCPGKIQEFVGKELFF